jgi:hypothetical protein
MSIPITHLAVMRNITATSHRARASGDSIRPSITVPADLIASGLSPLAQARSGSQHRLKRPEKPLLGFVGNADIYAFFMPRTSIPSRSFMRLRPDTASERWCLMGDLISVVFGLVIFAVLILYVPACEKV